MVVTITLEQRLAAVIRRLTDLHKACLYRSLSDCPEITNKLAAKKAEIRALEDERDEPEAALS